MKRTHGCFVGDCNGDGCVFDDGRVQDCANAADLQRAGLGRDECEHWKALPETKDELSAEEFIRKRFNVPGMLSLREYFGEIRWDIDTIVVMLNAFAETKK